jgi:hypothetical protein
MTAAMVAVASTAVASIRLMATIVECFTRFEMSIGDSVIYDYVLAHDARTLILCSTYLGDLISRKSGLLSNYVNGVV